MDCPVPSAGLGLGCSLDKLEQQLIMTTGRTLCGSCTGSLDTSASPTGWGSTLGLDRKGASASPGLGSPRDSSASGLLGLRLVELRTDLKFGSRLGPHMQWHNFSEGSGINLDTGSMR